MRARYPPASSSGDIVLKKMTLLATVAVVLLSAAQDQLATLLDAEHITHTNSGHFIQGENPGPVIDSVREVVGATRKKACVIGARSHGQCVKTEKLAYRS
jgi:hypothetical protein